MKGDLLENNMAGQTKIFDKTIPNWRKIVEKEFANELEIQIRRFFGHEQSVNGVYKVKCEKGVLELEQNLGRRYGYVFVNGPSYEAEMVAMQKNYSCNADTVFDVRIMRDEKIAAFAWRVGAE